MKKLFFPFVLLALIMAGCNGNSTGSGKVKVENKLNKNVVCFLGRDHYPDLNMGFTGRQYLLARAGQYGIDAGKDKIIDTLGLCNKDVWNSHIKHSMLMLFVLDKDKLVSAAKLEDALIERYYFTYTQLMKTNGVITLE